ncbi:MAG: hypothetical protein KJZ53_03545, partial [Anaerolineales bacterium]|nr:hypothetical protein [Anaerolineales bacterium]
MNFSFRFKLMSAAMAFVLIFSMATPIVAFANEATPEEPTTGESTPPAEEPAPEETPVAEEAPAEEPAPQETLADVVQALSESEAVLVDEEGEPVSLASVEAQEILSAPDPWFEDPGDSTKVIAYQADCDEWVPPAGYTGGVCHVSSTPIQAAINAAPAGAQVHVEHGNFIENVTINKGLALLGANAGINPNTDTRGAESVIQGLVRIMADNVIIDGFKITNPNGFFGVSLTGNYSNIVVTNNIVTEVGTNSTGSHSAGILIQPHTADNIVISNNLVDTVEASTSRTAQGIAILDSSGTGDITNLVIEGNVIKNITSDNRGAYGIQINHGVSSTGSTIAPKILNNEIANLYGMWAHGIGLEGDTPNALIEGNSIDNIQGTFTGAIVDGTAIMVQNNDGA